MKLLFFGWFGAAVVAARLVAAEVIGARGIARFGAVFARGTAAFTARGVIRAARAIGVGTRALLAILVGPVGAIGTLTALLLAMAAFAGTLALSGPGVFHAAI